MTTANKPLNLARQRLLPSTVRRRCCVSVVTFICKTKGEDKGDILLFLCAAGLGGIKAVRREMEGKGGM